MARIFILTAIGGTGLLLLGVWPGVLEDVVRSIPFCCFSLPILGFWFLMLICLAVRDLIATSTSMVKTTRWGLWSAVIMFVTMGLVCAHVPQRIALRICCSDLIALVNAAPADKFRGAWNGTVVGPYCVDRIAVDRRGGVFFRTHTGPDGIGPDQMSYGFVLTPNDQGTPFGNAHYRRFHLFGDWHTFAASDDW